MTGFALYDTALQQPGGVFWPWVEITDPMHAFNMSVQGLGEFSFWPNWQLDVFNDRRLFDGPLSDGFYLNSLAVDPTPQPFGSLALLSSDTGLFNSSTVPTSLPPVSVFDLLNGWHIQNGHFIEGDPGFWAVSGRIDEIAITPVPEPSVGAIACLLGIVLIAIRRMANR